MEFLFPVEYSQLLFDQKINKGAKKENLSNEKFKVHLNESIQTDSFICYILIKSSSTLLTINGSGKEKFQLEKVDYGSTSFLKSEDQKISPLISLYSLKLAEKLDREEQEIYELRIRLVQNQYDINDSFVDLNIIVNDINDNEPLFENSEYSFTLIEHSKENKKCLGL
jgi:hypothetical protein